MIDHIGVHVTDVKKSLDFYGKALEPLGYAVSTDGGSLSKSDGPDIYLYPAKTATEMHLAFKATSRGVVDQFHAAALAAGGRDNGEPGIREDYSANYYAAFVFDPDGNNVEAVCLRSKP
jgi:catechol 2,3-dioxygenase-like lactoylglutathione lyase family enzyme